MSSSNNKGNTLENIAYLGKYFFSIVRPTNIYKGFVCQSLSNTTVTLICEDLDLWLTKYRLFVEMFDIFHVNCTIL